MFHTVRNQLSSFNTDTLYRMRIEDYWIHAFQICYQEYGSAPLFADRLCQLPLSRECRARPPSHVKVLLI